MNPAGPSPVSIGEIVLPFLSLGTLITALITFGFLAIHKRDAHVYCSVFTLLSVSTLVVGFDAAVLVTGGMAGRPEIALQLSRLHELVTTAFAAVLPYTLWAVLPTGSRLRVAARGLVGLGVAGAAVFSVIAFATPELFVSVTTQVDDYITYSSYVGRGLKGALFPVRDAMLGCIILGVLIVGVDGIVRRHITGTNILLVAGIVIGTVLGGSAIYANLAGTYPGPFAGLPFSRVSLGVTQFSALATAAYVLRYVRQSGALDDANRELEHRRDRLTFLAYHNDLTQMPNKQALIRDIDALFATEVGGHGRPNEALAEAFLCDLDSFGSVEDSYGYSFSVSLLQRVGRRIHSHLTGGKAPGGTVYHIEGDRFAILIRRALRQTEQQRLGQDIVHKISTPIRVNGHEVFLSAGIGHYSITADAGHAEEVLRRLKRGLAAASESGDRVGRYSADLGAAIEASQQLVQDLRRAIREKDFRVYYQPIVDHQGRVCSCEALIRWHKADTERFISLAEQSGLIVPITEYVVRTVCADLAHLREVAPGVSVHINISARHITQIGFPAALEARVLAHGLNPSSIGVEITETSWLHEDTEVAAILESLAAAGFSVAIDDFGTGYSSMSYLKQIPATTLKIDRSFIRELPARREDRALVDAMISLAHDLGKRVIAEGVETSEQASYLVDAGVDCLQGYYFARPVPRESFAEALSAIPASGRRESLSR